VGAGWGEKRRLKTFSAFSNSLLTERKGRDGKNSSGGKTRLGKEKKKSRDEKRKLIKGLLHFSKEK